MNRSWISSCAALALVGAGVFLMMRRGTKPPQQPSKNSAVLGDIDTARTVMEQRLLSIRTDAPLAVDSIAGGLASVKTDWTGTVPPNHAALENELIGSALEFIEHRFFKTGERYIAWRAESGYARCTPDVLQRVVNVRSVWQGYFGTQEVPDLDQDALLLRAMEGQAKFKGGKTLISKISTEPAAFSLSIGRIGRDSGPGAVMVGLLGDVFQYGGNGTSPSWWKPPRSIREVLASAPEVLIGYASFLAEFADGQKRVVSLRFVRAPDIQRWFLTDISQGTTQRDNPDLVRWEY